MGDVYFGIEKKEGGRCKTEQIPKNQYAIYGDYLYVNFNECIYKTDIQELEIKPILWDVYNICYLDECIVAQIKKRSR